MTQNHNVDSSEVEEVSRQYDVHQSYQFKLLAPAPVMPEAWALRAKSVEVREGAVSEW